MVRVAFAFHRRARVSQGKNLGVRFSGFWMEAPSDHVAIFDEDAADLGVGSRGVGGDRLGQVQGLSHVLEVFTCRSASEWRFADRWDEPVSRDEEKESHACV